MVEISKKAQERRLRWYGHVMRKDEDCVVRRVLDMEVEGRRRRGRPKRKWRELGGRFQRESNIW